MRYALSAVTPFHNALYKYVIYYGENAEIAKCIVVEIEIQNRLDLTIIT